MSIQVNTNTQAINSQRHLSSASLNIQSSMQKLASGNRINSARDDAAGLQISNRLNTQLSGLSVAIRNANDGISMAQTAEGALQESTNILQRMRELAIQSANATNSTVDRKSLNEEVTQLKLELDRIADTTTFGGQKLLDGSFGNKKFQIGANAHETIELAIPALNIESIGEVKELNGLNDTARASSNLPVPVFPTKFDFPQPKSNREYGLFSAHNINIKGSGTSSINLQEGLSAKEIAEQFNKVSDKTGVKATPKNFVLLSHNNSITGTLAGTNISFKLNNVSISYTTTGSDQEDNEIIMEKINEVSGSTGVTIQKLNGFRTLLLSHKEGDFISFSDFTSSSPSRSELFLQPLFEGESTIGSGAAVIVSDGSVAFHEFISSGEVQLTSDEHFVLDSQASPSSFFPKNSPNSQTFNLFYNATPTKKMDISDVDISTYDGSQDAIQSIDYALKDIDKVRATLGAFQNRLTSTINNLTNVSEQVSGANARIQNTDYAKETAVLTSQQIIQQASTSILAQANQLPQAALTLLG